MKIKTHYLQLCANFIDERLLYIRKQSNNRLDPQVAALQGASRLWHSLRRPTTIYLLLALLLLWFALRQVSPATIWQTLQQLRGTQLATLALLNGLILGTMVLRWSLLLSAQGYRIPFGALLRYRLAAFGVTYFTPGPQFGGEPLQVYFVQDRHAVPLHHAIAAVTIDKVLEMIVNFGFLVSGALVLLAQGRLSLQWGYGTLLVTLLLLALPLFLLVAFSRGRRPVGAAMVGVLAALERTSWLTVPTWLRRTATIVTESEAHVAHLCRQQPHVVLGALLVTLVGWGLMVVEFGYAAQALGQPLSLAQVIMVLMAARVAYLLPMPAGIGTFETSMIIAFSWLHFDPAVGVALTLLIRGRDLFLGSLGLWLGGTVFWQRGPINQKQVGKRQASDSEAPML